MNAFNRALMVLLSLALAGAGLFVFLIAAGMVTEDTFATSPEWIRAAQAIHGYAEGAEPKWLGGGLGALIAGLLLFIAEVPLRKPRAKLLTLRKDAAGEVTVSLNGLRRLAEHVCATVPGVERVETDARADSKGLSIGCNLQLAPDTSAPSLAAHVRELLNASMEQHLGRPPARIDVHTQVGQPTSNRRRVR